jgi:hypothetical protein
MQRAMRIGVGTLLLVGLGFSSSPAGDPIFVRALHVREWVATSTIPPFFTNPLRVNDRACDEYAECGSGAVCSRKSGVCEQPG